MAEPLLSIQNLSVDFATESGPVSAVRHVNIDVHAGEIVAVVGESGSGKSVTALSVLRLLAEQAKYTSGEILLRTGGTTLNLLTLSQSELREIRGRRIGMIFQEPMSSLNPVIRCGDQVSEAIRLHKKISAREAKSLSIEWLEKVRLPNPASMYTRYPHQLSGGQKQRVMIAMAMCCDPEILICDEPTTALDVTVQRNILDLVRELQQKSGMGVIFITHDLGVVGEIADRAVVMYRGEVVETGSVQDIFLHAKHPYTKALLACRPAHHRRGERLPLVSDFMEGTTARTTTPMPTQQQDEILLSVKDLSVWFPGRRNLFGKPREWTKAVDNVSFDVYKGETLGLVGESGCGKTTLGRALLRLVNPQKGHIQYRGKDLATLTSSDLHPLRKEMQIVFQDPNSSLNPRISIGEAIAEPLAVHGIEPNANRRKMLVKDLLRKVDLKAEHTRRYPHEFSGGQRQRIVIARALSLQPSFIVCDESVSALDVSVQAQVLNLLNDLKREFGFTIIFISHDLSVVRYVSDRIMVMKAGQIVESGHAEDVYLKPQDPYTKNLLESIPRGLRA
jgi:peptide/nickel transport system ATP-binding protein